MAAPVVRARAHKVTWELVKGDTMTLGVTFVDSAGDPIDKSASTWNAYWLPYASSTDTPTEFDIDASEADEGRIVISADNDATAALTRTGVWWLSETVDGEPSTVLDGPAPLKLRGTAGASSGGRELVVTVTTTEVTVELINGEQGPAGPAGPTGATGPTGPTGSTDPEAVRDIMAATLVAGANMTITVDDPADTITLAASGGGSGPTPIGAAAPLAANLIGWGIPGISASWGANHSHNVGFVWSLPFVVTENETFDAYDFRVDTAQAGALMDIAIYSCTDWKIGTTATKVAGTEVTSINCATTGVKTVTLGAPKTLTPGRYVLSWVAYGSAAPVLIWAGNITALGISGFRSSDGTGAAQGGWVQVSGASSLAASYVLANGAKHSVAPIVMRRA